MSVDPSSPAFHYGVVLGNLEKGIRTMFENIAGGMRSVHRGVQTEEAKEALRHVAYMRRIDRERQIGLSYVRTYALKTRRELGLRERGIPL